MCRFSRRQGKLCPGAGKAVSRCPGKFTFIHYIEEKCLGSPGARGCVPAPGKLFPGAGEKSHSCTVQENKFWSEVLERFRSKAPERM